MILIVVLVCPLLDTIAIPSTSEQICVRINLADTPPRICPELTPPNAIMKFTAAIFASCVAYAAAQETNIDTIISNVQNITTQTVALTKVANNLTSLTDAITLNGVSNGVQEAINISIANAKNLPPSLNPADGIKLIPDIQALSNASVAAIDALIENQKFFVNNNIAALVLPSLVLQNQTSYEFNAEISARNAPAVQPGSALLAKPIFDALAAGVTAFTDNGTLCDSVSSCYAKAGVSNSTTSGGMKLATSYGVVAVAALVFAANM